MYYRKRPPLSTVAVLALCTPPLCLALSGCGSGSSLVTSNATGRAVLTFHWPTRSSTRLIPFASNSIRVQLTSSDGQRQLGTALLVRPTGGGSATATFDRVAVGPIIVTATAFPNADGSGLAQASAQTSTTVVANQNASVQLTMASTIDRLEISPTSAALAPGSNVTATVVAKDSTGAVVLTDPSTMTWQSSNKAVATVNPNGVVTAVASGSATITVTETESGKSVTLPVTVSTAANVVYFNDFQGAVGTEWSSSAIREDPLTPTDKLLGGFVNASVRLTLGALPAHNSVTVAFDLYVLNSWDGNGPPPIGSEIWSLTVANGGPTLLYTNFSNNEGNQSYPGTFPIDSYPARTGAAFSSPENPRYTVYHIIKTFNHTDSKVAFDFAASGLEDFDENESWAIDNVQISVQP